MAEVRKTGALPSSVVNRKMTRSFPVSLSFFVGAQIVKKFGNRWYTGVVDRVDQDEDQLQVYNDLGKFSLQIHPVDISP